MQFEDYTIVDIIPELPEVFALRVKPKNKKLIKPFKPGQFYHINNPTFGKPKETRQFSITTSPKTKDYLEFYIKTYGTWTKTLQGKKIGDRVKLFGPMGGFTIKETPKSIIFFAGGIGITPILSMLQSLHEQNSTTKVTLVYANKSIHTILKKKHLDDLFHTKKSWKHISIVSKVYDSEEWEGHKGHITHDFLKKELEYFDHSIFYICGSKRFTNNIVEMLKEMNVEEPRIKLETFLPARVT